MIRDKKLESAAEWTPEMMGKASDEVIAEELDLCRPTVADKRRLLGIPPFEGAG